MASGQQHDRATCWLALPYGLLWWPWLGPLGTVVSALAFLIGGLWLSPDLDTNSRPYQRWGPLRWLWWPYRKTLRHRSILSHTPVVGTLVRVGYGLGIVLLLSGLLHLQRQLVLHSLDAELNCAKSCATSEDHKPAHTVTDTKRLQCWNGV